MIDKVYFLDYLRLGVLDCASQYPWFFGGGT